MAAEEEWREIPLILFSGVLHFPLVSLLCMDTLHLRGTPLIFRSHLYLLGDFERHILKKQTKLMWQKPRYSSIKFRH